MRILRRRRLGFILAVIMLSVFLFDFITTLIINSIDREGISWAYIEQPGRNITRELSLMERTVTRAWHQRFFDEDSSYKNKSIKESFMENLRNFFLPGTPQVPKPTLMTPSIKPQVKHLWPSGPMEHDDRILAQLSHVPKGYNSSTKLKVIVVMTGLGGVLSGQSRLLQDGCPVNRCYLTDQRTYAKKADVLLWQQGLSVPAFDKPSHQIWIYFALESPYHTPRYPELADKFNWSATYRTDSTIVAPYEIFVPYKNISGLPLVAKRNYAEGKSKMAAWFVSNCNARNNRQGYVAELQKYINVDIYGRCGNFKCPRNDKRCFETLSKTYKFYLAFENSNCKDYITEKFFWNGLLNDIIPVVMGARREDYKRVAPPQSFIHVDDFESPKELAEYLKKLDENDDLYNQYFRWKGTRRYINTKFWCRLCAMAHEAPSSGSHWYQDFWKWWGGPDVCVESTSKNPWSSWKRRPQKSP